ncbi:MAG: cupin domain-containing protein [Sphingomonadaceae bacterium]
MDAGAFRRVVTGLDEAGRSAVVIDGRVPDSTGSIGSAALVWRTEGHPADNSGAADTAVPYELALLHGDGSTFAICEFAPHSDAFMHATDTIDYLVIVSGRVTLVLEDGEAALGPGDFVVDRGVMHGWRNPHHEPCLAAVVNLPAKPVGNGRTI